MPDFKKIPDGYDKLFIMNDSNKVYDVYYNANEKDSLKAYMKIEVK